MRRPKRMLKGVAS